LAKPPGVAGNGGQPSEMFALPAYPDERLRQGRPLATRLRHVEVREDDMRSVTAALILMIGLYPAALAQAEEAPTQTAQAQAPSRTFAQLAREGYQVVTSNILQKKTSIFVCFYDNNKRDEAIAQGGPAYAAFMASMPCYAVTQ
jgi:hypothetical protein